MNPDIITFRMCPKFGKNFLKHIANCDMCFNSDMKVDNIIRHAPGPVVLLWNKKIVVTEYLHYQQTHRKKLIKGTQRILQKQLGKILYKYIS